VGLSLRNMITNARYSRKKYLQLAVVCTFRFLRAHAIGFPVMLSCAAKLIVDFPGRHFDRVVATLRVALFQVECSNCIIGICL
jgi:hypothetical protein